MIFNLYIAYSFIIMIYFLELLVDQSGVAAGCVTSKHRAVALEVGGNGLSRRAEHLLRQLRSVVWLHTFPAYIILKQNMVNPECLVLVGTRTRSTGCRSRTFTARPKFA